MTSSLPIDTPILVGAILVVIGLLVVGLSDRLRLPTSLLSLGLGMLIGDDGLAIIPLSDFELVRNLSVIALIVILFEGGVTTKPSAVREAGMPGLVLATIGVLITAGIMGLGVELVFGLGWRTSMLLGSVVASTDAAVVFNLVRRAPMPRRLASILEVESGANDPVAIVLTVGVLATFGESQVSLIDWVSFASTQFVGGIIFGIVVGLLGRWLLNISLRSDSLYPIIAMGVAGLAYGVAAAMSSSGFMAVYVAGLIVGATVPRRRRTIRGFLSSLSQGADMGLFLLLGLLVFPSELPGIAGSALIVTAILVLVARPVAVVLSLLPFKFSWREQTVLSWCGLRGAIPIVLSTFPASAGVPGGQTIFNVIFFVVLTSTLIQGTSTVPLLRWLGLAANQPAWRSLAEAIPVNVPGVDLVEVVITPDVELSGKALRDHPPGPGILVIGVLRDGVSLLPTGSTVIQPGDVLVISLDSDLVRLTDVTAWARGEEVEMTPAEDDSYPRWALVRRIRAWISYLAAHGETRHPVESEDSETT